MAAEKSIILVSEKYVRQTEELQSQKEDNAHQIKYRMIETALAKVTHLYYLQENRGTKSEIAYSA